MGMHGNTPDYATCTKGSFKMLKSLAISESWLSLTKQAWKSIINFVYVFLERLSSPWQGQGVMFPVALKASTFNLM